MEITAHQLAAKDIFSHLVLTDKMTTFDWWSSFIAHILNVRYWPKSDNKNKEIFIVKFNQINMGNLHVKY